MSLPPTYGRTCPEASVLTMSFGTPSKLHYATRLAAALGFVGVSWALLGYSQVTVLPVAEVTTMASESAPVTPAASLVPPADSVFGFEPQPIAAAPQPAGFDLPLAETERLGVPEPATPLVAGLEETERRIEAPAPPSVEQSHEPQAEARMAAAPAVSTAVAAAGSSISDADVDRIARRVVELLGDKAMRDVAWEVVPDLAEVVIRDRLRELESQAESLE